MAPLPDNNTPVLFLEYTSGGTNHTAEVRLPSTADPGSAAIAANALRTPLAATMLTADRIFGARYRAAGSLVSFPIAITATTGTIAGTLDPDLKPMFYSFTGRSADGRRVRFTWFTQYVDPKVDGWRDATPGTAFTAVLTALQGGSVDARTISGQLPIWNPYVNFGANGYWQRKTRRTDSK